jgi:hypothetical protein
MRQIDTQGEGTGAAAVSEGGFIDRFSHAAPALPAQLAAAPGLANS